MLAYTSQAIHR